MAKLYEIADGYRNIQALLDNPEIPMEIVVDGLPSLMMILKKKLKT